MEFLASGDISREFLASGDTSREFLGEKAGPGLKEVTSIRVGLGEIVGPVIDGSFLAVENGGGVRGDGLGADGLLTISSSDEESVSS